MNVSCIRSCVDLIRLVNSVMVGFAVIVGVTLTGELSSVPPPTLLSGFFVGFFISASSMVLNDIADIEIDRVNAPDRPLPSGKISVEFAWKCYVALVILGMLLSVPGGLDSVIIAGLGGFIASLYDLKLKLTGLLGNFAVAFSTSLPLLYAFTLVDRADPSVLVFWAMVFLTVLGREIAKDIADVEGDTVKGAKTIPIKFGAKKAAYVVFASYFFAIILSPLPAFRHIVNPKIYVPFTGIVDIMLIYASAILIAKPARETALYHKKIVLLAMIIGLIDFLLSVVFHYSYYVLLT